MEKVEVATAAKGTVELLNLSETEEKDFYLAIYTMKHNTGIHTIKKFGSFQPVNRVV